MFPFDNLITALPNAYVVSVYLATHVINECISQFHTAELFDGFCNFWCHIGDIMGLPWN